MNLILEKSGGNNIVLWPMALPAPYPIGAVQPSAVEVWIGLTNEAPSKAILFGIFHPAAKVRIPRNLLVSKSLRVYLRSVGPDGAFDRTYLSEAITFDVDWTGKSPILDTIDIAPPTVGDAPDIRRIDWEGAEVIALAVRWERPALYGQSRNNAEIRMTSQVDAAVVYQTMLGDVTYARVPIFPFRCDVQYRWRNWYRLESSDGWSDWSPASVAYALGDTLDNAPDSELIGWNNDPDDSSNPVNRETLWGLV